MNTYTTKTLLLLSGALLLVTQPGASCVSDGDSSGGGTYDPPRQDPYPSRPDREEDANYIPQRAEIVREGRGTLRYTTDADGTIYVQNLKRDRTELTRRVYRGQVIEVVPQENRIRIDDDTASKTDLKSEDVHRIYLLRDRRFENDRDRPRDERNDRENRGDRDNRDQRDDRAPQHTQPPRGVPGEAQLMGEGRNKEISFRPSKTGAVYIYSNEGRKLVTRIDIRGGEQFVLSPGRSRATINGKTVQDGVFDTRTTYRVFFNREG